MSSNSEHGRRLRALVVGELERKPYTVDDLMVLLDLSRSSVQHHLKKLRKEGSVFVEGYVPGRGGPVPKFRAGFGGQDAPRPARNEDIPPPPEPFNPHELIQTMARIPAKPPQVAVATAKALADAMREEEREVPPPTQPNDDLILDIFRKESLRGQCTGTCGEGEEGEALMLLTSAQILRSVRVLFRLAGYAPLKWPEPEERDGIP